MLFFSSSLLPFIPGVLQCCLIGNQCNTWPGSQRMILWEMIHLSAVRHKTWEGMIPLVLRILLRPGNWRLHCSTKLCPRDRCSICLSSFLLPIVLLCKIRQQQWGGDKLQVCFSSRQIILWEIREASASWFVQNKVKIIDKLKTVL